MRTIIKRGSVEVKTVAELEAFLNADDNCVLGMLLLSALFPSRLTGVGDFSHLIKLNREWISAEDINASF